MTRPADLAAAADRAAEIVDRRNQLAAQLGAVDAVREVLPSDANFLLVRFADAAAVFDRCAAAGLLVRDFSRRPGLEGCLRITVGSEPENRRLLEALTETVHA
jgi:histidinol-phosphate aminotransferase